MKLQTEINKTLCLPKPNRSKSNHSKSIKTTQKALKTVLFVPTAQQGGRVALFAFTCGTSLGLGCAATQGLLPGTSGGKKIKKIKSGPQSSSRHSRSLSNPSRGDTSLGTGPTLASLLSPRATGRMGSTSPQAGASPQLFKTHLNQVLACFLFCFLCKH